MDIARPSQAKAKLRRRILIGSAVALGLIAVTVVLARLKPAVPSVDRSLVWVDTVKRGPMVRQVHGPGTLVPVDIRWIAARTQGRVDRIVLLPGATVQPDSVIMILSNPDVTQAAVDTQGKLEAGEAEFANLKYTVQASVLQSESDAAAAKALFETSRLTAQVDEQLFQDGLVSELELKLKKATANQSDVANSIAQKRYAFAKEGVAPQLAVKQAEVDRLRADAQLKKAEADALNVRAGMSGILQIVPVEVGAQVTPGTNLARVADPPISRPRCRSPKPRPRMFRSARARRSTPATAWSTARCPGSTRRSRTARSRSTSPSRASCRGARVRTCRWTA